MIIFLVFFGTLSFYDFTEFTSMTIV